MLKKRVARLFLSLMLVLLFGGIANADTMALEYSFTLDVTGTNPYGLNDGDLATIVVTVDTDQGDKSTAGYSMHSAADDSEFSITLNLNGTEYTEVDDGWWSSSSGAYPLVTFNTAADISDWTVNTIDFGITDTDLNSSIYISYAGLTAQDTSASSSWSIVSTSGSTNDWSAIPEPATFTLFGLGLFGLAWGGRRRSFEK